MAPPAGIDQKKNTKKSKSGTKEEMKKNLNKDEKKSKKEMKLSGKFVGEKSEVSKKNKKRKIESLSERNQESNNDAMNISGKKDKKNKTKNEKKQKLNEEKQLDNNNKGKKEKKIKNEKKQRFNENQQKEESFNKKDRTITDERFSSSIHDPMFRRMKKKDSKIEIDSRFSKMFEHKDFAGSSAPVDKRGKLRKEEKRKGLMSHYYLDKDNKKKTEEEEEDEKETDDASLNDDISSSSDDVSSSEDEYEDDAQNLGNHDISNYLMADHEDTPTIEKETHRLAIVNMDWDHIKAVDLYVVMTSCLPQGGRVESVTVYPSEFGMKCMEIEVTKGPGALMDLNNENYEDSNNNKDHNVNNNVKGNNNDKHNDDGDNMSEDDDDMSEGDDLSGQEEEEEEELDDDVSDDVSDEEDDDFSDDVSSEEEEEDDDEVNEKLRAYELNKLRYYFAVVVCDSSSTANHIYNTLDKTEFLDTSNVFDLRFIPDSMMFPNPPRDTATEVPVGYKEPDFETRALQHSKVKLTWEDEKTDRKKVLRRNFNPDQMDELNIYLASSDSSEDENEESKKKTAREKFLSLLKPGNEFPGNGIPDSDQSEEESEDEKEKEKEEKKGDMEITFNTDLEALSKKISDKREKGKEETVWEAVLRKKREKKQALKMSQINNEDSDSDFYNGNSDDDEDDFFMEEKKGKGKDKGKKREKEKQKDNEKLALEREREASRAELELLLAEEEENKIEKKKGYNMKKEKREKKKGKKGKKEKEEDETKEKVPEIDVSEDPRFERMFTSHLFALDPTDPQYKRSAAYLRNKSNKKEATQESAQYEPTADPSERENDPKSKQKNELSASISSVLKNIKSHQFV